MAFQRIENAGAFAPGEWIEDITSQESGVPDCELVSHNRPPLIIDWDEFPSYRLSLFP